MHMADALVPATVGGGFWAISGGTLAGCSRRVRRVADEGVVPLMGVLGAFVFVVQMVNFAIPGTGSSGHLGGGLLLAALLGPEAAVLVMGSVLLVQALFFADGGLLAFGCNLFNMGILPAFVAYPLVYQLLARRGYPGAAAVLGSLAALQFGALAAVLSMGPDILVLDEPSTGLDPWGRRLPVGLLQSFTHTRILATHDLDLVLRVCPRILVLHQGRLEADGPTRAILADQTRMEAWGLEAWPPEG